MAFLEGRLALSTEYLPLGALELNRRRAALRWRNEHGEREGGCGGEIAGNGYEA